MEIFTKVMFWSGEICFIFVAVIMILNHKPVLFYIGKTKINILRV